MMPNLYESKIFFIGLLLGNKIIKVGIQGTLIILSVLSKPKNSNKKNKKKVSSDPDYANLTQKFPLDVTKKIYINQLVQPNPATRTSEPKIVPLILIFYDSLLVLV